MRRMHTTYGRIERLRRLQNFGLDDDSEKPAQLLDYFTGEDKRYTDKRRMGPCWQMLRSLLPTESLFLVYAAVLVTKPEESENAAAGSGNGCPKHWRCSEGSNRFE